MLLDFISCGYDWEQVSQFLKVAPSEAFCVVHLENAVFEMGGVAILSPTNAKSRLFIHFCARRHMQSSKCNKAI